MGCSESSDPSPEHVSPPTPECRAGHYSECPNLNRLRDVLCYYHKWTISLKSNEDNKKHDIGIYEYIHTLKLHQNNETNEANGSTETYSNIHLLKDYHHLMMLHQSEFEDIYNYFCDSSDRIECSINHCSLMSRNHRARSRDDSKNTNSKDRPSRAQLYYASDDTHQVITQQLLDQIHSYIYHSFDIGLKLTKEEEEELAICDNTETEMKNDQSGASGVYLLVKDSSNTSDPNDPNDMTDIDDDAYGTTSQRDRKRRENIGRFMQRKKKQIREIRNEAEMPLLEESNKFMSVMPQEEKPDIVYSFGKRFFYNKNRYKLNDTLDVEYNIGSRFSDWFVEKKYDHLYQELTQNKSAVITAEQWTDLYEKAKYYLKTDYVLTHCKDISIEQLICIQIYCNFDELQSEFTKTYRHNKDESDVELKQRHREFCNLGEILRSAVEWNGIRVAKGATKTFYHGINIPMNFTSTIHKFYSPTSTSGEYTVALAFTNNEGIVLELNDGTWLWKSQNSMYFDCEFISDFGYEKEKFFMGGAVPLKIASIFDVKLNRNYAVYIELINLLLSIIDGDIAIALSKRNECAMINLLKHESKERRIEDMPEYIDRLLHSVCLNVDSLTTRWSETFGIKKKEKHVPYKKLGNYLCAEDCEFFDLTLLCTLFPNLESITITRSILTNKVLENIVSYLYKMKDIPEESCVEIEIKMDNDDNNKMCLNNVVFQSCISSKESLSFKQSGKLFGYKLRKVKWEIIAERNRLVVQHNKRSKHDRTASVNRKKSLKKMQDTEGFLMALSFEQFEDD